MEPFDSYYVVQRLKIPCARFYWLYIIPALGVAWIVYLVLAASLQFFDYQCDCADYELDDFGVFLRYCRATLFCLCS